MVKIRTATYAPRFRVGASSEVTASAVSSLMPAAAPAIVVPAVHVSMGESSRWHVEVYTDEHVH